MRRVKSDSPFSSPSNPSLTLLLLSTPKTDHRREVQLCEAQVLRETVRHRKERVSIDRAINRGEWPIPGERFGGGKR